MYAPKINSVLLSSFHSGFTFLIAECPQCYFGEIRQMFTFNISLYCPKAYHRSDHSICVVEYHRIIIIPKGNINTGTRTQDRLSGLWPYSCNLLFEINKSAFGVVLLSCLVSELQKPSSPGLELRTLWKFRSLLNLFLVSRHTQPSFV
jgi:hypothetical protein